MKHADSQIISLLQQIKALTGGSGGLVPAISWGDILGTLSEQPDLQAALDEKANEDLIPDTSAILKGNGTGGALAATAGTDYATPAQAAHSGGVIGTAAFDPSAASIGSPVYTGIISSVAYDAAGTYSVVFTANQPNIDYGINVTEPIVPDRITSWGYIAPKLVSGFQLLFHQNDVQGGGVMGVPTVPHDPSDRIVITVTRLSQ